VIETEPSAREPLELAEMPAAGAVVLDLRNATVEIRPGKAGEALRVDAEFDTNHFELTERYDEGAGGEGWSYEIGFRRTSRSAWVAAIREMISGFRPELSVKLPPDLPYDLRLAVAQGGGEVELGGLWLTNIDASFAQGGGAVEISEPLRFPADQVRMSFSQGGGAVEGLGNASPRRLELAFNMGGGAIDLRGAWLRDADIRIEQSMGGVAVQLPRDVVIRGIDRPGLQPRGDGEIQPPVLTIETSSRFGELEFME
jgi:hypothetical protein